MGALYEVEDETVGRRYVLKTLHPELVDRADLAIRMREEARALGRLHHPNIVQVITAGVTTDAQKLPFYVMERLVGHNLRTVLDVRKDDGGIGIAHAYRIAIDVLGALQHAHENQLVHRDVKPENIFLHRGPKATEFKLVDFGIVRLLTREATLTRGKYIGTMKYSSPEQVTALRPIGPASDIYSLSLVLYEMIRGRGPFDDAPDYIKIGLAHAQETPSPLANHVRNLPPEVDALVMQALAKDPSARPTSSVLADGFRRALRQLEATPNHRTEVELLSIRHAVEEHATVTSTSAPALPETMAEGPAGLGPTRVEGLPLNPTVAVPLALGPSVTATLPTPPVPVQIQPPPSPGIDRNAPTRIPAQAAPAMRAPSYDTVVDAPSAAPPQQERIATMQMGPPAGRPQAYVSTVHTRPRKGDHRPFFLVGIAAAVAVMMIAGAVVFVRRPWVGHGAPATVVPSK